MTAPTKTPRVDAACCDVDSFGTPSTIEDKFQRLRMVALTLETELAATRAEADELARRVWRCVLRAGDVDAVVARVREEMFKQQQEKDLKS